MGDIYPKLKVAAVQAAPVFLDREATVDKACRLILEAGENGADAVVFPECFIAAYPCWFGFYPSQHPTCGRLNREMFKNAVEIPSAATDRLCQAARQANTYVVMGLNERRPGMMGTMYNTNLFIHRNGSIMGKHQKLTPTVTERLVHGWGDGRGLRVFPTEYGAMGTLICSENGNPLFRFALYSQGEVVHFANWPAFATPYGPGCHREAMLLRMRNYAWEGKVYVVSSAEIFTEEIADILELDGEQRRSIKEMGGCSAIIDPNGIYLAGPAGEEETILYAEIDLEKIVDARIVQDYTGHYNRFDVVSLSYNPAPYVPMRQLMQGTVSFGEERGELGMDGVVKPPAPVETKAES